MCVRKKVLPMTTMMMTVVLLLLLMYPTTHNTKLPLQVCWLRRMWKWGLRRGGIILLLLAGKRVLRGINRTLHWLMVTIEKRIFMCVDNRAKNLLCGQRIKLPRGSSILILKFLVRKYLFYKIMTRRIHCRQIGPMKDRL